MSGIHEERDRADDTRTPLLAEQANALRDVAGPTMQVRYTTRVTAARRV